ncbi:MAG: SH3 domain-containing protein [Nitrospira sp.]|nr:SH3 domain-containing protein [Nitrospira sp.]
MFSSTGVLALSSEWTNWHLLFARQPEPDLEFTDEDLDEALPSPAPPMHAPKRSGQRPFLWILLLLLVAGIGYVAMDPDEAMQLLQPYLGGDMETTRSVPLTLPDNTSAPTVIPPELVDRDSPASAEPLIAPPVIPGSATATVTPASPVVNVAGPLFSEGQRVTVISDSNRPKFPVPLFVDVAGTNTSTIVQAGATLMVLDGDYQQTGWVYTVRTEDGRKGWIPERSLKLKR